ncbi:hypothetical protein MAHJHV53_05940 [Mycobacterium avium subsp. hominissuis]|uniref:Uncharacterized protein n=1 Tax=Mycobacterium kiyosense TaxID=2871094 RepID=A0AA37VCV7_9MYCO|nr:hypothetical protein SRL2020028_58110 [Mycobacterium kiyosense]GLB99141.1 hypothetical protein SRL2020226_59170 [Mycobacterium kiyosense]
MYEKSRLPAPVHQKVSGRATASQLVTNVMTPAISGTKPAAKFNFQPGVGVPPVAATRLAPSVLIDLLGIMVILSSETRGAFSTM